MYGNISPQQQYPQGYYSSVLTYLILKNKRDGRVLICRGELDGLLVWDLATNQKICTLAEDIHEIEPLALSRERQFFAIRVNDTVQVWA